MGSSVISFSPNRFTCMAFLLLRKGCLPRSYDFDSVSGLASSECWVRLVALFPTLVFHLSPTLGLVGGMISLPCLPFVFHLSPTCLPLWVWFHHLSPICLSFVSHLAPTLGRVGRMISFTCLPFGLSFVSTCLPLWVRLVA